MDRGAVIECLLRTCDMNPYMMERMVLTGFSMRTRGEARVARFHPASILLPTRAESGHTQSGSSAVVESVRRSDRS